LCQIENWRLFHLLTTTSCRPTTCIKRFHKLGQLITLGTWELFDQKYWEPNKLWALFLWRSLKGNLTSRVVNSFWVNLVPFWMGHTVGTTCLKLQIFAMFHQCKDSSHLDKTNACGVQVIHYDIIPKNLNNMEHKFHL